MKKGILLLTLGVLATGSIGTINNLNSLKLNHNFSKKKAIQTDEWFNTSEDIYRVEGSTIVSSINTNKNHNFYINKNVNARGNYEVSATFKGTQTLPSEKETDAGIVPWYIDENNYVVVYLNWSSTDRPSELREIQITGRINGETLAVSSNEGSSFENKEWNDFWTDGNTTSPNATNTLKIVKTRKSETKIDILEVFLNNISLAKISLRDTLRYDNKDVYAGIYAYNDTFTFEDFTLTNTNLVGSYKKTDTGILKGENDKLELASPNSYTFDLQESNTYFNNMYVQDNQFEKGGYKTSFNFNLENKNKDFDLYSVINYVDEYTYLVGGLKVRDNKTYLGFDGKIAGILGPVYTDTKIEHFKEIEVDLTSLNKLTVEKTGTDYSITLNDEKAPKYEISIPEFIDGGKVGFSLSGVKGTLNNFNLEPSVKEYSWYSETIHNRTFNISSRRPNSITYADGTYTFTNNAVTIGDNEKVAKAYFDSGYYGNVTQEATFDGFTQDANVGFYAYLKDVNNYVSIKVNKTNVLVEFNYGDLNKTLTANLPDGFTFDGTTGFKLKSDIKFGKLNVYINETLVHENVDVSMLDTVKEAKVGFNVSASATNIKDYRLEGFRPLDPIDNEDFTFFGQRTNSWTYDKENKVIKNNTFEGVANGWKATNALYKNEELKDLFVGSAIQVTKREGNEWKVGLMPYYLDADNHVICWFSQWSDGGCKINVTARLNGRAIGQEWRESGEIGVNLLENNYLEASIQGNIVSVYVNKSFTPILTTEVEGLIDRNMTNAFTGFQVGNGIAATFSEYNLLSERRVFGTTEAPTLIEVGTRVTEGTVNEKVKLPIYTATNSSQDILNPEIEVKDPSGKMVVLNQNSFTPTVVGTYKVKVTCVDNWGNEATPIEYDIVVKEAQEVVTPEEDTGNKDPNKNGLTGLQLGLIIGGSILGAGVLGLVIFFIIKKFKKEK